MTDICPECDRELVHSHDRYNYEKYECPDCGRWKRPGWDDLRDPPEGA